MKKTAKRVSAAKKRGLLLILALILLSAPLNKAVAQTLGDAPVILTVNVLPEIVPPAPVEPPSIQDTLLEVCQARDYGEDCAKTLLGMAWKESRFVSDVVGDHGLALGWFQIHYVMHRVSPDCAKDLTCSANWTLDYMEQNQYPKYVRWAVQCHNGCGLTGYRYADSALWNGERLWNHEDKQIALAK